MFNIIYPVASQRLFEAFLDLQVLSDPEKKAKYDKHGEAQLTYPACCLFEGSLLVAPGRPQRRARRWRRWLPRCGRLDWMGMVAGRSQGQDPFDMFRAFFGGGGGLEELMTWL